MTTPKYPKIHRMRFDHNKTFNYCSVLYFSVSFSEIMIYTSLLFSLKITLYDKSKILTQIFVISFS